MTTRRESYVFPSTPDEARRLERQARLYGGVEILRPFLSRQPAAVLDAGCGSGCFTRHVQAELPRAAVVGLDRDTERLARARAAAGEGVRFQRGDLHSMPFADDSFDLVFSRFVLVHLADPMQALAEMARVTRPGGQLVAYDMIHDGIWFSPPKPALERLLRVTITTLRERGAEPNQGLHLALGLERAGLQQVQARVVAHHALSSQPLYGDYRDNWLETVESLSRSLADRFEPGLAQRASEELRDEQELQLVIETAVLAWGDKPAG